MPFKSSRAKLNLSKEDKEMLESIAKSRIEPASKVERAKILLKYASGIHVSEIARQLQTNRPKVERCLNKALGLGIQVSLSDLPRQGKPVEINDEAKMWLLSIACMKPVELGYASEFWTMSKLAEYIRRHSKKKGYNSLSQISKGTVSKILTKSDIKPHKMSYYTKKRDPDFEAKMAQVLYVYKEVELYSKKSSKKQIYAMLSYDEKPGIQAIENISEDLPPRPGLYSEWKRDREYKRHGTLSLLSSIDLLTGKIYGQVFDRHRSREFIQHLKYLDRNISNKLKLKIILDNHSSHISKETQKFLRTMPNRFEFIFTPKHGSWLNLIEVFYSKMTRTFLKGIQASSKKEMKERIKQYISETNKVPVIFKWGWKLDDIQLN